MSKPSPVGENNMNCPKILVVQDEEQITLDIRKSLQNLGYSVSEITFSGEDAINKVAQSSPNLVLIDICFTGKINGVEAADIIQNQLRIPVLYLTDYGEEKRKLKNGVKERFCYIPKIFGETDLKFAVEMALSNHKIVKIEQEQQKLMTIINSMAYAVVVTNANGYIQMMNPLAESITGWKQHEVVGKDFAEVLSLVDQETNEKIANLAKEVIRTGQALNLPDNCILITKSGDKVHIGDSIAPIRNEIGEVDGAVLVFKDLTQRKKIELQLLRNAFYDSLTDLPNRVLFLDRLKQVIERSKRRHNYKFAVLFLDLDGFKSINDRFGHGVGDSFLVEIARRLEKSVRTGDTVARFGGDEFAVLLEDIKGESDATHVAMRIQEQLSEEVNIQEAWILPTASIGIALSNGDNEEPQTLLRNADTAMYQAKQQGKANYRVFR